MCGIVGAIAERNITPILLEGLRRLEYRGYDSAGVAVINKYHHIKRVRALGKVQKLADALKEKHVKGKIGIAHTRWATHGKPSMRNAHPHMSEKTVAVVHNGIIENHEILKKQLIKEGYKFTSETDTEVIAHTVHKHLQKNDLLTSVRLTINELDGAYALGIINSAEPDRIIAVRSGSPLVIGIGLGEHFIGSDHLALLPMAQKFIYLEEGDIAEVKLESVTIFDKDDKKVERKISTPDTTLDVANKGKYRHFMQKEIFEQPEAIANTLDLRVGKTKILNHAFGEKADKIFSKIKRVQIVACGTSYHAGLVARYWLEEIANIPTQVEIASEIRYRKHVVQPNTLFVTLSQSGETADTLEALRQAKSQGYRNSLTICNVPESSLVRESDLAFMTKAGPEIGVASTKAFTTQLTALLILTTTLGRHHGLSATAETKLVQQLNQLPALVKETLSLDKKIKALSEFFADKHHAFFLGRGSQYPIAMEGALKLKEISYIHAEAYPAGELKHGPLALVDSDMPVIVVAPNNELLEKLISNIHEVRARGGKLIIFADNSVNIPEEDDLMLFKMPTVEHDIAPIVYTIPLQLLAYHAAVLKGTDVDQPRNLAKSVTVE